MKRNNKKGFTIVELVIVIAVIAILAGVLIPTFAGVVKKANESKALQDATNIYKQLLAEDKDADLSSDGNPDLYIVVDDVVFSVENGKITKSDVKAAEIVTASTCTDEASAVNYYTVKDNVYTYAGKQTVANAG